MNMPCKAVLFDLDGTLLNTLDDLADATNAALAELGLPGHPSEAYKRFVGDGLEELVRRAMRQQSADKALLARGVELARREYGDRWAKKTRPYPGIPDLLDGLGRQGIPMAVLSNKPDEFTRLCVARLLPGWHFQVVQGATAELPRKPDPHGHTGGRRCDGSGAGRSALSRRYEHRHVDRGRGGDVPRQRTMGISIGGGTARRRPGRLGENAAGCARVGL